MSSNSVPTSLAHEVAVCAHAAFATLPPRGKPSAHEWTVLSAVIAVARDEHGENPPRLRCIALGTGTKCIGRGSLRADGTIVNDSHAEVIARRALCRYLFDEVHAHAGACTPNECTLPVNSTLLVHDVLEKRDGDVSEATNNDFRYFSLRKSVSLYLYVSDSPCGASAIYSDCGEAVTSVEKPDSEVVAADTRGGYGGARRTGAKEIHPSTTLRTKSGRSDLPPAARTRSLSCSDKVARWIGVGLQSALVSHFLRGSLPLAGVVVSCGEGGGGAGATDSCSFAPQAAALDHALLRRGSASPALQQATCLSLVDLPFEAGLRSRTAAVARSLGSTGVAGADAASVRSGKRPRSDDSAPVAQLSAAASLSGSSGSGAAVVPCSLSLFAYRRPPAVAKMFEKTLPRRQACPWALLAGEAAAPPALVSQILAGARGTLHGVTKKAVNTAQLPSQTPALAKANLGALFVSAVRAVAAAWEAARAVPFADVGCTYADAKSGAASAGVAAHRLALAAWHAQTGSAFAAWPHASRHDYESFLIAAARSEGAVAPPVEDKDVVGESKHES
jgi:hypothetical protein